MGGSDKHRPIPRLDGFFAGLVLLLILVFAAIYWIFVYSPTQILGKGFEGMRDIALELAAALPVEPVVRERTILVFQPPKDRADWLAVEESFLVRHEFEHTFLGSQKRFEVEAMARVGMGFSFSEEWTMRIEPGRGTALVGLPEPQVLFVEVSAVRIRRDEDGWWNRLTALDREEALRKLEEDARTQFDKEALGERARSSLLQVFNQVLRNHGLVVEEIPTALAPSAAQRVIP